MARRGSEKKKKVNPKYIAMAADLKRARRNTLIALIASVIVGFAFWGYITFSGINDHTVTTSVIIFGATVILVFCIGLIGNRLASHNTELNKIKNEYGVTNEQIKDFIAKH